ncbi:MAG TPA: RNA 2',3'-cyclic phosphodiesterase [Nitrospira sp.]|nr:RNA 2',3'-cyclic phosphodiesterase [Nitrospira sp.]
MIRTFLAVELSDALRMNLSRLQLDLKQRLGRELPRDVRMSWVQSASMHLTIRFFGDIDEQLVMPMQEAIRPVVGAHRAIHIPLDRLGVFPRLQQPRVLWAGPPDQWERGEEAARLASLHGAVEEICRSLDFAPDDRPLSPHLTLARIKEGERQMGQILARSGVMDRPLALGSLAVEAIVLMKSDLKPTGPVYTKLWEVKTGG